MANTAAHADEEGCFGVNILADSFHYRVEAFVTPTSLSLAVAAHVVVELFCVNGILGEPGEERLLRFVCQLEWTASDVSRVLIASFLQVGGDGME